MSDEGIDMFNQLFSKDEEVVSDGSTFKEYIFNSDDFVDKSCVWYGESGTGKSFHLRYCLSQIKKYIPRIIVFSPTAKSTGDYNGIVDDFFIYESFDADTIIQVIAAQKDTAELYRSINRIEVLEPIFLSCPDEKAHSLYKECVTMRNRKLEEYKSQKIDIAIIQKNVTILEKKVNTELVTMMKIVIIKFRNTIDTKQFTELQKNAVKFIDLNPRILFIFDDAQETISEIMKKNKSQAKSDMRDLFFQGRHNFISHWYAVQDESTLAPAIRKNAFVSVFTCSQSFTGFLTRGTNGIAKNMQKIGMELNSKLFKEKSDYRRIIYFKECTETDKFQYHIAKESGLFLVGAPICNKFCDILRKKIDN